MKITSPLELELLMWALDSSIWSSNEGLIHDVLVGELRHDTGLGDIHDLSHLQSLLIFDLLVLSSLFNPTFVLVVDLRSLICIVLILTSVLTYRLVSLSFLNCLENMCNIVLAVCTDGLLLTCLLHDLLHVHACDTIEVYAILTLTLHLDRLKLTAIRKLTQLIFSTSVRVEPVFEVRWRCGSYCTDTYTQPYLYGLRISQCEKLASSHLEVCDMSWRDKWSLLWVLPCSNR
jgi:hypothetical protein